MRDGLHKSVPPRTLWAKVLRLARAEASQEDLRDALTLAVRRDAGWIMSPWGQAFERAMDLGSSEPPRVLRRLNSLRGLSHEQVEKVLTRSP